MQKIRNPPIFFLFMVAAALLFSAGFASAVEKALQAKDILLGRLVVLFGENY